MIEITDNSYGRAVARRICGGRVDVAAAISAKIIGGADNARLWVSG